MFKIGDVVREINGGNLMRVEAIDTRDGTKYCSCRYFTSGKHDPRRGIPACSLEIVHGVEFTS